MFSWVNILEKMGVPRNQLVDIVMCLMEKLNMVSDRVWDGKCFGRVPDYVSDGGRIC